MKAFTYDATAIFAVVACCRILAVLPPISAFVPSKQRLSGPFVIQKAANPVPISRLYFFGRKDSKDESETNDDKDDDNSFFAFFNQKKKEKENVEDASVPAPPETAAASTATVERPTPKKDIFPSPPPVTAQKEPELSLQEQVVKMRDDAARARLEAERLDAELTLRKIEKLEKKLASTSTKEKDTEQLQREMDALLNKLNQGDTATKATTSSSSSSSSTRSSDTVEATASTTTPTSSDESTSEAVSSVSSPVTTVTTTAASTSATEPVWPKLMKPFDEKEYKEVVDSLTIMPDFILSSLAFQLELEVEKAEDSESMSFNRTEVAVRMDKARRFDFSYSSMPAPTFTARQISDMKRKLDTVPKEKSSWSLLFNDDRSEEDKEFAESAAVVAMTSSGMRDEVKDLDQLAQLILEYDYYAESREPDEAMEQMMKAMSQEDWLKPLFSGENGTLPTALDNSIDNMFPKCLTKVGVTDAMITDSDKIPTEAQVRQLIADVLPKAKFKATSKPQKVLGGFVVRGICSAKNGDDFVDMVDTALEKSSLQDKMTVLYSTDFTMFFDEDSENIDPFIETAPVLYIVAPNICRDPRPVQLSVVSALGLATSWYLSLYPFLLNPKIAARVDEQLALADANMAPDLGWLTELSLPLFTTFVAIQLIHEIGHLVAAGANGIKTSVPTFVPSIITGITGSVTTFKSPPKNKAAMFDFAISGPLAGMIASIACVAIGSQLTTVTNPSFFPALPIEILRQSTLGGGIIEGVLGGATLNVPDGALGTEAVAGMTVPLHPVAIAGYISLIVNALAVLPIGNTDGGRAALTLFGRGSKLLIGNIFASMVLLFGVLGSDLFLFYFAFFIAFQAGNEIPSRNEVDKLDIPRVFLAAGTYVIAALVLIPFK